MNGSYPPWQSLLRHHAIFHGPIAMDGAGEGDIAEIAQRALLPDQGIGYLGKGVSRRRSAGQQVVKEHSIQLGNAIMGAAVLTDWDVNTVQVTRWNNGKLNTNVHMVEKLQGLNLETNKGFHIISGCRRIWSVCSTR